MQPASGRPTGYPPPRQANSPRPEERGEPVRPGLRTCRPPESIGPPSPGGGRSQSFAEEWWAGAKILSPTGGREAAPQGEKTNAYPPTRPNALCLLCHPVTLQTNARPGSRPFLMVAPMPRLRRGLCNRPPAGRQATPPSDAQTPTSRGRPTSRPIPPKHSEGTEGEASDARAEAASIREARTETRRALKGPERASNPGSTMPQRDGRSMVGIPTHA